MLFFWQESRGLFGSISTKEFHGPMSGSVIEGQYHEIFEKYCHLMFIFSIHLMVVFDNVPDRLPQIVSLVGSVDGGWVGPVDG